MDGKLIKDREHYYLTVEDKIFGDIDGHPLKAIGNKLSLKNCEAIANGYDLDEKISNHLEDNHIEASTRRVDVIKTLILEILGDKKFSEGDMINAVLYGTQKGLDLGKVPETDNDWVRNYIKSLQQTEWDVEICCYVDNSDGWLDADSFNSPLCTNTGIPKLDENECLILKRK